MRLFDKNVMHKNTMHKAMHLKKLVQEAAKSDPNKKLFGANYHKYCLNPVAAIQEVRRFEQDYNLTLPEEYVFFLTKVGNGGAGPYYGLYSLQELRKWNNVAYHAAGYPVFIDKSLTSEMWHEKISVMNRDDCSDDEYDVIEAQVLSGALVIGTQGCSFDTLLMCNGSETGKIVYGNNDWDENNRPFFTDMTFLDWYEKYFEEIIAGHNINCYGIRKLNTEDELLTILETTADISEKNKAFASLWRFERLSDKTITFLENIKEREFDTVRVALIIKSDKAKGIALFEHMLNGENVGAAVGNLRYLPKEYKNNYYQSMLKVLYGENNIDFTAEFMSIVLYYLGECDNAKAADIVNFAITCQNNMDKRYGMIYQELCKTAIYVMGKCDDALDYTDQFIQWMKCDYYWIAHTALQAMIPTGSRADKLIDAYDWMREKYKSDSIMRANLGRAPHRK